MDRGLLGYDSFSAIRPHGDISQEAVVDVFTVVNT
jgi:hypothetical protein